MQIKGFIFDLDGVLVSTDKFHYLAWKSIADKENIYFDEKINDRLRGVSRMGSLNIILERAKKEYSESEKHALCEEKNGKYRELLNDLSEKDRFSGVAETLTALKNKGYKIAVGSSSKNTPLILEKIGLAKIFDAVADGNCITKSKPDPEVFLKAAEMLKLSPKECFVVEDSRVGIDAALAGGFNSIATGDAAAYGKADYVMETFWDVLKIANDCKNA